ncbi:hypothetical protein [Actinomadura madurae]|uniref:hypothetical protein n=1 Tax=Actinomadura madurae TaxID=1993 RepID=UPI0015A7122D|nr:hypothetical protein [Actinomadura madurae]
MAVERMHWADLPPSTRMKGKRQPGWSGGRRTRPFGLNPGSSGGWFLRCEGFRGFGLCQADACVGGGEHRDAGQEHPLAAEAVGEATQPPGTGRTHDWCSITQLPTGVSNAAGWSSCMITTSHNRQGGIHIRNFYNSERVLEDDPFYVKVEP